MDLTHFAGSPVAGFAKSIRYFAFLRGSTDSFFNRFLGRRNQYKTEKMLRKARKPGKKPGKILSFSRKKSINFSFFCKFPNFSYFFNKKRIGCPSHFYMYKTSTNMAAAQVKFPSIIFRSSLN